MVIKGCMHFLVGHDQKICLWDVGAGEVLSELDLSDILFSISFNWDGSQFVTAGKDKKVRVHDARSLKVLHVSLCLFH